MPLSSEFHAPLRFMEGSLDFLAGELASEEVQAELQKMASVFPWVEDDEAATYFELSLAGPPDSMRGVRLVCSKTYARGLVLVTIYHGQHVYCVVQNGEGEQPLLDVRFPDVSAHNQGILLRSYSPNSSINDNAHNNTINSTSSTNVS
ncbi:hypothetical protein EON64_11280, partial [archaeon]